MSRTSRAALLLCSAFVLGFSFATVGLHAQHRRLMRSGFAVQQFTDPQHGHHIRYMDGGDGFPLLMLHGFGGDAVSTWRHQAPAMMDRHRVILPDLLWFGGSYSDALPTLQAQAQAQLALLDALGIEQADVMGISYGGFVLLQMARMAPERIHHMIVVDSPGPTFSDADLQDMLNRFGAQQPSDIFLPTSPQDVETLFALTVQDPPQLPNWLLRDIQNNLFSQHRQAQHDLLVDLPTNRFSLTPEFLEKCPQTLLIWGEHDPVFPLETGQRLADALQAPLVVMPSALHGPNLDDPRLFNDILKNHLDH